MVLVQAMARLLGELAQTQGLLPKGSLEDTALLVWVWGFGEMEMEQKEDYNCKDASKVTLRARQQLLDHLIHQSRHFPALCQGFFFYFLLPCVRHHSRCPFSCSFTSSSPIFSTVICVTPKEIFSKALLSPWKQWELMLILLGQQHAQSAVPISYLLCAGTTLKMGNFARLK